MNISIDIADWKTQQAYAQAIRFAVFVIEQNIPADLEWDAMDEQCLHAIAYDEHRQSLGTGRLLPDGHIGRMAVKKSVRGMGVGGALLEALVDAARKRGDRVVKLNAQTSAETFYQAHGFMRTGAEFLEAGIPHISMERQL